MAELLRLGLPILASLLRKRLTASSHASAVKAGSHYERFFQRWPAFEKSNK